MDAVDGKLWTLWTGQRCGRDISEEGKERFGSRRVIQLLTVHFGGVFRRISLWTLWTGHCGRDTAFFHLHRFAGQVREDFDR